jgi:hypothetical protein
MVWIYGDIEGSIGTAFYFIVVSAKILHPRSQDSFRLFPMDPHLVRFLWDYVLSYD